MMIGLSSIGASCSPSQLTSPVNYSNIGGPTTFTWTPVDPSCVNWVKLMVGSGPRSSDLFQSSALQNYGDAPTSATVQVPTDGRMIYVSLVSAINFNPIYQDYVFMAIPPAAPRIPDPTPAVTVAAPVVAPPPQTNTAVLPHVSVDVLPVITVGNSGAPVNVPPSADTQIAVPSAPPPSTQTTTVSPGAGTSAPPPTSSNTPLTSTSGTTSTSSTTPPAAADDGTIFGIPTTYALIGAAAVLFLMMGKK